MPFLVAVYKSLTDVQSLECAIFGNSDENFQTHQIITHKLV